MNFLFIPKLQHLQKNNMKGARFKSILIQQYPKCRHYISYYLFHEYACTLLRHRLTVVFLHYIIFLILDFMNLLNIRFNSKFKTILITNCLR